MGERAQKVVVRGGRVEKYWSQWGGQSCAQALLNGLTSLQEDLNESRREEDWMDPDFAEGGYLIDFDHRVILVHTWDSGILDRLIESLKSAWPDWSIEVARRGVSDFESYLKDRSME